MNVLLVHLNPLGFSFQAGLASLAAVLGKRGRKIALLSLSRLEKKSILSAISNNNAGVVLVSLASDSLGLFEKVAGFISENARVPVFCGGIHPTLCPEEVIKIKGVAGLCVGEGEEAASELIEALEKGDSGAGIRNLWVNGKNGVSCGQLRPLIPDLDALPFPDYLIFKKYAEFGILPVILSRGCAFSCAYCCNNALKSIYAGRGTYLRRHSPGYGIELIKKLLSQFPYCLGIEFYDDLFISDKKWLGDFTERFAKLGLGYICNARFDILDEENIKMLSGSGCFRINAAVECANEQIRLNTLKRNITNAEIETKAALVKKYNIHLHTHNMIGVPYETEADILQTVILNKRIKVDSLQASIYNPYPRDELTQLCLERGWIDKRLKTSSYRDFTVLRTKFIKPHLVNFYFLCFRCLVFDSGPKLFFKKIMYWLLHLCNNRPYLFLRALKLRARSRALVNDSI